MAQELYRIDGVLWLRDIGYGYGVRALCPVDKVIFRVDNPYTVRQLVCDECSKTYSLPRNFAEETSFILNKIKAKELSDYKVIDFDGEAIPLAEAKDSDEKYFVIAKLVETKVGKRMVVYAGEKGAQ